MQLVQGRKLRARDDIVSMNPSKKTKIHQTVMQSQVGKSVSADNQDAAKDIISLTVI